MGGALCFISEDPSQLQELQNEIRAYEKQIEVYPIPNEFIPAVVGLKGQNIRVLKENSGCNIVAKKECKGNIFIIGKKN